MNSNQLQQKFSDYVRHGPRGDFPEVDGTRVILYREHLLKKLSLLLSDSFALTQEAMGMDVWEECILHFLANASASGESILGLSDAFYTYLITCKTDHLPYLENLATFEYSLIELFYLEDIPSSPYQLHGNRLESPVVLNSEHRFLCLDYPVFKCCGSELVEQKGAYYLLLYRHPILFTVEIIELSPLYFSALTLMAKQPMSFLAAMEQVAHEEDFDIEEMLDFFDSAKEQGFILGFQ